MKNYHRTTVIIGPSGAGKSTLVQRLVEQTGAELVRTYTDRARRGANDDDTHIFVDTAEMERMKRANLFRGDGPMGGAHYGLPYFSNEGAPKIALLRAPFVPTVLTIQPDAAIVQVEAPVDILIARLTTRGDEKRTDVSRLQKEILFGRTVAHYVISTDQPIDDSYDELLRAWNEIHQF